MTTHLRPVSKSRVVEAQIGNGNFNPLIFLQFLVAILQAVDALLQRKTEVES